MSQPPLSSKQVAHMLGYSAGWVTQHAQELQGYRIGKLWRFHQEVIAALVPTPIGGGKVRCTCSRITDRTTDGVHAGVMHRGSSDKKAGSKQSVKPAHISRRSANKSSEVFPDLVARFR